MATNTSISLDEHFSSFLAREVATGCYRSASEVVRAGLRLLEDQETQMSALRAALIAGEESGQAEPFGLDAFIAAKKSWPGAAAAQRDLSSIWDFAQECGDAHQAEVYSVEIREAIGRIVEDPERGRRSDQICSGDRSYVVGSHLSFCIERCSSMDVIRILHQRLDPTRHL